MPETTKKPIKIVPNTIKTIPKIKPATIIPKKTLEEQLEEIYDDIDVNVDDLPDELLEVYEELEGDYKKKSIQKNWKLWLTMFTPFILPAFIKGVSGQVTLPYDARQSVQSNAPEPKVVVDYAKKYFEEHGLELVKTLSQTDCERLKVQLKDNWGKGPDAFKKSFQEDYANTKARLDAIYRTEYVTAQNEGILARSRDAGHKMKQWNAALDERTCPVCGDQLHGTIIPIEEEFTAVIESKSGSTEISVNGPPVHPNCRCVLTTLSEEDYDEQKQNSAYLADAFNTIKLNYKCKAGTVDDSNKCELENSDVPETRTFYEENIKSKILSLNDSKYPKDAVFRSKSRSNMTKNVELDILNNDNHVKILSDNIDRLHYQCDNLKIPRLRGIVADKNTKAGLASMADGILAVTPDMFRNDPDSEVDLRLSRNQERLNYINNKLNLLESFIQSDKEKWTKNNPSLVNSGMKFEESTFYKTGYPWLKEINEYKSEKNNIMARINDLNTKKTNALIYTWKPGMPDSEKPFGASEYFPFEQSPKLLLDHEFGHHIHQLYGVKNAKSYAEPPLEKKIDQIYKKSEKDGTLIVPSKYAAIDHQEWFAESYSLYVNGRDDLVTPGLIDLFKKIGVKRDN